MTEGSYNNEWMRSRPERSILTNTIHVGYISKRPTTSMERSTAVFKFDLTFDLSLPRLLIEQLWVRLALSRLPTKRTSHLAKLHSRDRSRDCFSFSSHLRCVHMYAHVNLTAYLHVRRSCSSPNVQLIVFWLVIVILTSVLPMFAEKLKIKCLQKSANANTFFNGTSFNLGLDRYFDN